MVFQNLNENFIDIFHRLDDFLFTSTRLSNPVLRCFCTIGNFINSSHDGVKMTPQHTAYVVLSSVTAFHCFDGCISSSIFLIQSIKICFHLFFNFFRIFCAQHQIRFLIVCNSFQPALYMVTEILEIIYLLFLSAATCTASALGDRTKTIVDVAEENGDFTTLLTALNATNLTDTLKGEGPFTVFAPTNRAFAALPEGTIETLLNDTGTLKKILLYHVAGQRLMAKDVVNMSNITTLEGQKLKVNVTDKGVFVGKVKIIMTDINARNGVIHEIDAVLIPPEKDIVETAKDEGNFTKLLTALNATNLTDTLKGEGPFTVFAPTDRAFAALPEGTIETLLNNTSKLKKILLFHVVSQRLMAKDVVNMSNITTLEGQKLPVNVTDKGVLVGKAKIIMTDVNASNGVIHEIDTVLIPPENNQMGGKNP